MWLLYTTVFGFMVLMIFGMMIMMHFLKRSMIAEDSTTIDERPETNYNFDS
ncbi:hypothetical protein [Bhargavaea massiliensis]|uniref:hypothetical protein n=1 Tax=Bhargavaea massiliensis TaxID=2697500 RepID=UPI001BCECD2D|nr:hypothetical protein [Bhargavaea massiliensis]